MNILRQRQEVYLLSFSRPCVFWLSSWVWLVLLQAEWIKGWGWEWDEMLMFKYFCLWTQDSLHILVNVPSLGYNSLLSVIFLNIWERRKLSCLVSLESTVSPSWAFNWWPSCHSLQSVWNYNIVSLGLPLKFNICTGGLILILKKKRKKKTYKFFSCVCFWPLEQFLFFERWKRDILNLKNAKRIYACVM